MPEAIVEESTVAESSIPVVLPGAKALSDVSPQNPTNHQLPDDGPVPLSFPAILRNPKLADRFSHLHERPAAVHPKTSPSKARRDVHEGKRWIRRRENGVFCIAVCADHFWCSFNSQPSLRITPISYYLRAMIIPCQSLRSRLPFPIHYQPTFPDPPCCHLAFPAFATLRPPLLDYIPSH